jgi:DNA polymerase/3'-5' exonuclease PolX
MKTKIPLAVAREVANQLVEQMAPACKRIEVAGSIRRCRLEIGDIEIVAIPTVGMYDLTDSWLSSGVIRHTDPRRWGSRLRSFRLAVKGLEDDVQVDLFLQPDPATWGVNMMIRTGSADFSRRMVTKRSAGGFMPDCYQVREARVWAGARLLDTPEEEVIFHTWGMAYVVPPQRTDWYEPNFGYAPIVEVEPVPVQAGLF